MSSASRATARHMKSLGLVFTTRASLSWTRKKRGALYHFFKTDGRRITDETIVARLNSLAVPPAYTDVRYASNPKSHLQAVGVDAAGRVQYRYHADWDAVREKRKVARLAEMAEALPRIRRTLARALKTEEPSKALALAACTELVARTAIRAGGDRYESLSGSRGATTLLKSNVKIDGGQLLLSFRGKGGKDISRVATARALCRALETLRALPGKHAFQYRGEDGAVYRLRAADVNAYLSDIAACAITLKDFRTLTASSLVADRLASLEPGPSQRIRTRQIKEAVAEAAAELANTPTVARKSYVHATVVEAFESGKLKRLRKKIPESRAESARVELLAAVVEAS